MRLLYFVDELHGQEVEVELYRVDTTLYKDLGTYMLVIGGTATPYKTYSAYDTGRLLRVIVSLFYGESDPALF